MILSKDWREFIESLNSHNVEYVLVGGQEGQQVVQTGLPPNRIDITTSITGVDDSVWEHKIADT